MPAVQFSNCENVCISFEHKHIEEMNWKTNEFIFRFYIVKISSGFFFWIRTELIVCIFKLLNSMKFVSHLQQFGESFCYNNLTRSN